MVNQRDFAVYWERSPHDIAAEDCADALVTETDAQSGNPRPQCLDQRIANASLVGRAGTGRDDDVGRRERIGLVNGDIVIATYHDVDTELRQILVEVVGKAIVVID
jgi:hypothetical protein